MEFGKSLREAREAKGYTIAQIAETTHMLTSIIEGLEGEDFSQIVAPIYGRGFVRLYCEAVGLEAKPFVDEFMEIVNGNREVPIRERSVSASAEPVPAADPAPVAPPPPTAERDLFTQEPTVADTLPVNKPSPDANPAPGNGQKADISRYASPFREEPEVRASFAVPVLPWRLILLGAAGLALLAILVCGVRALYCATSSKPGPASETRAEPAAESRSEDQSTVRTRQQNIPSLYID